jgi:hypothetical protein
MARSRILLIVLTVPVAAWAALVTATFGMAAMQGSDVVAWMLYGGASAIALVICGLAASRLKSPTLWTSAAVIDTSVLLTLPGTLLLCAFAKNPP